MDGSVFVTNASCPFPPVAASDHGDIDYYEDDVVVETTIACANFGAKSLYVWVCG